MLRLAAVHVGILLLWSLAGCSGSDEFCRLAPIPVHGHGHAGKEALSRAASGIDTQCDVLSANRVMIGMPRDRFVLDRVLAKRALEALLEAEKQFYGESVEEGKKRLARAWELFEQHPEWLPAKPEMRSGAYRALLVAVRVRSATTPGETERLLAWLARHMPDQEPTVRLLPPRLEASAASQVDAAVQDTVLLSAPAPAGCPPGSTLRVNGLAVGELPVAGLPTPRGIHAVWFDCQGTNSWVRIVELTSDTRLDAPDMALESGLRLSNRILSAGAIPSPEVLSAAGPYLRTALRVKGLVFVPVEAGAKGPAMLSTPYGNHIIPPGEAGRFEIPAAFTQPPFDWRRAGMWTAYAASAVLLGCGVGANLAQQSAIDDTNTGLQDRRNDADAWKMTAISCYAGAGALLLLGATLNVFEVLEEPPR